MAASTRNIACFALFVSIITLQFPSLLDQPATTASTTTASAQPSPFDSALLVLLPLAVMEALLTAAAIIYSRHHHATSDMGASNWHIPELVFLILCMQVGLLQFFLFAQQPTPAAGGADDDDAAQARALAIAAVHALPVFASVTFYLGITLVYAHVGNGGGGADGTVPSNAPAPAPAMWLLAKITLGAALVCVTGIVLAAFYTNTK